MLEEKIQAPCHGKISELQDARVLFYFFLTKKLVVERTKKKEKEDLGSPLFLVCEFLPAMAPTVKRIMTQPIVSSPIGSKARERERERERD